MFTRKLCSVLSPAKRTDKDETFGELKFKITTNMQLDVNFETRKNLAFSTNEILGKCCCKPANDEFVFSPQQTSKANGRVFPGKKVWGRQRAPSSGGAVVLQVEL